MGSLSCAASAVKNVTGSMEWVLQPAGKWVDESYGHLLASLVVMPMLLFAHRGVVFLASVIPHPACQKDPKTIVRFPGLSMNIAMMFAQGTLFNAMRQLFDDPRTVIGVTLSVITFILLLLSTGWIAHFQYVSRRRGIRPLKYKFAPTRVASVLRPFLVPTCRWVPALVKYRYPAIIGAWAQDRIIFTHLQLFTMTLSTAIAAYNSKTEESCDYQYIALGIIPMLSAGMFLFFQPLRFRALNITQFINGLLVGLAMMSPAIPVLQQQTAKLIVAVSVASAVNGVLQLLLSLHEYRGLMRWERTMAEAAGSSIDDEEDGISEELLLVKSSRQHSATSDSQSQTSQVLSLPDQQGAGNHSPLLSPPAAPTLSSAPANNPLSRHSGQ